MNGRPDTITAVIDGTTIHARVAYDPQGRICSARSMSTGDPVTALINPDADWVAAVRAALTD